MSFKIAILDEVHYLKSRHSERSMKLVPVILWCERVILLTGTPLLSWPNECFNVLKMLWPDIFSSFTAFANRYCNPKKSVHGVDFNGHSNLRELHMILAARIMIRRMKIDVLKELPSKRR